MELNLKEESTRVSKEEGMKLAKEMGCTFIESSAKTKVGVQRAFQEMTETILSRPELWAEAPSSSTSTPSSNPNEKVTLGYDEEDSQGNCCW